MEINLDKLIQYISQVGFPIVVATFLLLRTNGKMDKLKDAINDLKHSIDLLKEELINKIRKF
ncbi:MAG: YvrJ family protein [Caldisericia bacterium]